MYGTYHQIQTIEEGFKYFTDVAVANLDHFCLRKSANKCERERHIGICKKMFETGKRFGINLSREEERFTDILKYAKKEGYIK